MSAYVVSKAQIDLLITAGLKFGRSAVNCPMRWRVPNPTRDMVLSRSNAAEIGALLWIENVLSVCERYPLEETEDLPGVTAGFGLMELLAYQFEETNGPIDPVVVLKQVANYVYQSREHDGWAHSAARAYCDLLTKRLIAALPGYDAAPWGFDDPQFFARRAYLESLKKTENPR